jgi:hypothetical protein
LGLFIRSRLLKAAKPLNIIGEESPPLRFVATTTGQPI